MVRSSFVLSALALSLVTLSLGTGCASRDARPATPQSEPALESADGTTDPSFLPPDESGVSFVEKKGKTKTLGDRSDDGEKGTPMTSMPAPNARRQSGSIHPATN